MAAKQRRPSRGQLLDVAFDVAWKLCAYGTYGRSLARARGALRRRCPGFGDSQYEAALQKAVELYDVSCELVQENLDFLLENFRKDWPKTVARLDGELRKRCPGFNLNTLRGAVGMAFYYWHLR